jgi:hypothetical protein
MFLFLHVPLTSSFQPKLYRVWDNGCLQTHCVPVKTLEYITKCIQFHNPKFVKHCNYVSFNSCLLAFQSCAHYVKYRVFQKELYNFDSLCKCIQRRYLVFWAVIMKQRALRFAWGTQLWFNVSPVALQGASKKLYNGIPNVNLCGECYENIYA